MAHLEHLFEKRSAHLLFAFVSWSIERRGGFVDSIWATFHPFGIFDCLALCSSFACFSPMHHLSLVGIDIRLPNREMVQDQVEGMEMGHGRGG